MRSSPLDGNSPSREREGEKKSTPYVRTREGEKEIRRGREEEERRKREKRKIRKIEVEKGKEREREIKRNKEKFHFIIKENYILDKSKSLNAHKMLLNYEK